jgi:hypothetical protein
VCADKFMGTARHDVAGSVTESPLPHWEFVNSDQMRSNVVMTQHSEHGTPAGRG